VTKALRYRNTLSATLTSKGKPLAGRRVTLRRRAFGATTWTVVAQLVTSSKGTVKRAVTQRLKREQFQFVFAGDSGHARTSSGVITVTRK
jgi:5-hydroxyisourate hydrolase-like protein (transthyretin family)